MTKPSTLFLTKWVSDPGTPMHPWTENIVRAEHGQADVHLAVIASLRTIHANDIDIHLSSFEPFRQRGLTNVTFHSIVGKSIQQAYDERHASQSESTLD